MSLGVADSRNGEDLKSNCTAAKLVADMFATSYGPPGMYKVVISEDGQYYLTKNADSISKDVSTVHPVVRLLVEAAKSVKSATGDGFISTVVFAGYLIARAWRLIQEGVSREVISRGYHLASTKAGQLISENSILVSPDNRDDLTAVAKSFLATKLQPSFADTLAHMLVDALLGTGRRTEHGTHFDRELVKVEARWGGSLKDTILVGGVALHKRRADRLMPSRIENARIALIQQGLSIKKPDMFTKVVLGETFGLADMYKCRWAFLEEAERQILETGANVVICASDLAEELRRLLASHGVLAVRNVSVDDMKIITNATGGSIVASPTELTSQKLGYCDLVEERIVAALDRWLFFEGCYNKGVRTILIRGPTEKVVDEVKRVSKHCLKMLETLLSEGEVVPGGGVIEVRVADTLKKWSLSLAQNEQYVVSAFADELERLPALLGENAGRDPLTLLGELRRMNRFGVYGFDATKDMIIDPLEERLLDPAFVKKQYIKTAAEVAISIIRVDRNLVQKLKVAKKSPIPEAVRTLRRQSHLTSRIGGRRC
ncbi:MAG: TCP-1/cpn60 chaperonin family protein [Nitrososphaerota archaeon]